MKPVISDAEDFVVLVDSDDRVLGVAPKLEAHREGRLHRAVSVVLFDQGGRVLMQRRAAQKYHSGGLWSNTCCGHPRPDESVEDAAGRRLADELGIHGCQLVRAGSFVYSAQLGNGLAEHELDHVLVGRWTGGVTPNPAEVDEIRWVTPDTLQAQLARSRDEFTAWVSAVVDVALGSQVDSALTGG